MEKLVTSDELERISKAIRQAIINGRRAVRDLGSGLITLWEEDLWELGENKENGFWVHVYDSFGLERRSARAAMVTERTFRVLEEAHMPLPLNDSQAAELGRLEDDDKVPNVWRRIMEECEKQDLGITVVRVRDAVRQERAHEKPKGVDVDMGNDEDELFLSEQGEESLARIKALCGKKVADAIRQKKNIKLTEDGVKKWADQDDDIVKELPRYVFDQGWSVRKALNYMSKIIDGDTQVDELIMMARNRGGRLVGNYQDARIVVEIVLDYVNR